MKIKSIIFGPMLLMLLASANSYGGWIGPKLIINEKFGLEENELGMEADESSWNGPSSYCTSSNRFILADSINNRIKIYELDGRHIKSIDYDNTFVNPMDYRPWPDDVGCLTDGIYVEHKESRKLYSYGGEFIKDLPLISKVERIQSDKLYTSDGVNSYIYDKGGNLLRKVDGAYKFFWNPIRSFDDGYLIGLGDKNIRVMDKERHPSNMYAFGNYLAAVYRGDRDDDYKYRICAIDKYGRCIATATTPLDDSSSNPIVAENGNIYMSIIDAASMKIIKWEWKNQVDPPYVPDPPKDLSVRPMLGWLLLEWAKAVQDGGCLTGYEIARSLSENGKYEVIAKVPKGTMAYKDAETEIGKTYYYKIRSVVDNLYSPYTEPVHRKRLGE